MLYGLGILFSVVTALNASMALTTPWLVTAYILIVLLIVSNLYADRWMTKVAQAAESSSHDTSSAELEAWRRSSRPIWSLGAAVLITLAIVFVMVVKPTLF